MSDHRNSPSSSAPNIECCVQCGEPKNNPNQQAGDEVANGWPRCENPSCVAFGESTSSAWYRPVSSPPDIREALDNYRDVAKHLQQLCDMPDDLAYQRVAKEFDAARSKLEQLFRQQQEEIERLRKHPQKSEDAT